MRETLILLVPPLAGAIIGFITNVLAIRMLFRPLRAYHVFGLRIPFTPGILPRERAKLARSIGAMVKRELLTPEILRERLAGPELREQFHRGLARYTGQLAGRFTGIAETLYPRALETLTALLREPRIRDVLVEQGREIVDAIILDLSSIQRLLIVSGQFDRAIKENMPAIIDDLINRLEVTGRREDLRDSIIARAKGAVFSPESQKKLDALITEKLFSLLDSQLEELLQAVDIQAMVEDRINRMDMLQVEGIILDVMANQLKWIDVFGAILGFLIGLFQSVFAWTMRG
jgi:uncharacterized membrane-anchored protein YjiN (DUF445 family)